MTEQEMIEYAREHRDEAEVTKQDITPVGDIDWVIVKWAWQLENGDIISCNREYDEELNFVDTWQLESGES